MQEKNGIASIQRMEYATDPSVFAIELYGLRNDFDTRLAVDMLEAAFETFPDCEYCIISLPSDIREFPLLHQFTVQLNKFIERCATQKIGVPGLKRAHWGSIGLTGLTGAYWGYYGYTLKKVSPSWCTQKIELHTPRKLCCYIVSIK